MRKRSDKGFAVFGAALFCAAVAGAETTVDFAVDLAKDNRAISPLIFGSNSGDLTAEDGIAFRRSGGNRLTGYNWENNASHAGTDWQNSSDSFLGGGNVPGKAIIDFIDASRIAGEQTLITLPAAGYVSRDKKGTVAESEAAPSPRWAKIVHEKGAAFAQVPDTTDGVVYTDEFVALLKGKYGDAGAGGVKYYSVDNEPGLWMHTHPRIHPDTTKAVELIEKTAALATAVKKVDPMGEIFGGVFYGYGDYQNLQNAPDWGSVNTGGKYAWYLEYFLDEMKKASDKAGVRLLDVLDIHWYPEATGDHRITEANATTVKDRAARLQAPRSLWDSAYVETSWISQWATPRQPPGGGSQVPGSVNLLPRVFESIRKYYPGTRLSITEYNYGEVDQITGGLAQADFLGVLAATGVFAANFWQLNVKPTFAASAFRLFRNYDGKKSAFGSVSAAASASDREKASIFASYHPGGDEIHVIVLNKDSVETLRGNFTVSSPVALTQGKVFGFDKTGTDLSEKTAVPAIAGNAFTYALAPLSANHFVLKTAAPLPSSLSRRGLPAGHQAVFARPAPAYLPDGRILPESRPEARSPLFPIFRK